MGCANVAPLTPVASLLGSGSSCPLVSRGVGRRLERTTAGGQPPAECMLPCVPVVDCMHCCFPQGRRLNHPAVLLLCWQGRRPAVGLQLQGPGKETTPLVASKLCPRSVWLSLKAGRDCNVPGILVQGAKSRLRQESAMRHALQLLVPYAGGQCLWSSCNRSIHTPVQYHRLPRGHDQLAAASQRFCCATHLLQSV
jgi:hypothetical protein